MNKVISKSTIKDFIKRAGKLSIFTYRRINMNKNKYDIAISLYPRILDIPNDVADEIKGLLTNAGFIVTAISINFVEIETTYGIGEEEDKNNYAMWYGPTLEEKECVTQLGRSDMSVIVKFHPSGKVEVIHKWSPLGMQWMKVNK